MPIRVLIADDDTVSLTLLRMILTSAGEYEVVTATHGEEAWSLLDAGPVFKLCIFDVMMPNLDGLELTKRARKDPRFVDQKVLLCTALNDRDTVGQAATLGISHYLVKPYSKDDLLKKVKAICRERVANDRFDSIAQVAVRLGVSAINVKDFRRTLYQEVAELVTLLRAALAEGGSVPDAIRVNAHKGAAINLGAHSLARQLAALETAFAEGTRASTAIALDAVEMENTLLRRALDLKVPPPASVA